MITKTKMFSQILDVAPGFIPIWQEFEEDWADESPNELPHYIVLGELARYMASRATKAAATEELQALFAIVERWHVEGDEYVKEAATIGLLEGLQNATRSAPKTRMAIEKFLLPETAKWWRKIEEFWENV